LTSHLWHQQGERTAEKVSQREFRRRGIPDKIAKNKSLRKKNRELSRKKKRRGRGKKERVTQFYSARKPCFGGDFLKKIWRKKITDFPKRGRCERKQSWDRITAMGLQGKRPKKKKKEGEKTKR